MLTYRGKENCESTECTRMFNIDGTSTCYGWHCGNCDQPCSPQGHFGECYGIKEWEETRLTCSMKDGRPAFEFTYSSANPIFEMSRSEWIEWIRGEYVDVRIHNRKVKMETSPWEESES